MPHALAHPVRRAAAAVALVALAATALGGGVAAATTGDRTGPGDAAGSDAALTTPFALVDDRDVDDRLDQPEDRYALAGGCYVVETVDGYVARGETVVRTDATREEALPFHLQPTELGRYLLAADEGPADVPGADWDDRSYLTLVSQDVPAGVTTVGVGLDLWLRDAPSDDADFAVVAAGEDPEARDEAGQPYLLTLPDRVAQPTLGEVRFHLAEGDEDCARWPEVATNTSGEPAPNPAGPAAPVKGFFEAHVHGMAYEFLGGELRCGQPWHRWGVEYALPDCYEDGNLHNGLLEVGLAGQSPTDPVAAYDPVGWPTFAYWPKHDTLTHEQYYWRWLERAYHGGLRLTTILLVENTALCQLFPVKENSCNEMDSVRLQAQRMFELQDYVDAQSGGPGEGWLRIVTTPGQARQVINDGRLAIVLGIEVSELFDCRAPLDQPQCTTESISASLREVADMGVRQMELINKFDNGLSGVTGDGGETGMIVNQGQFLTSGHFWDFDTCPEDIPVSDTGHAHAHHDYPGEQHDKTQLNLNDDVAQGNADEIDVLAGIIIDQFGPASRPAPVYPSGPHCNTRGLSDLGRHLISEMAEFGILFDPDHMSAAAQREALDHLEDVVVPALHEDAEAAGRPTRIPGVISSHSWGNDVVYQRIFDLDGIVAPRTNRADRFVEYWAERRDWHEEHAPAGAFFGLGYGADTNGLGGQPGPRSEPEAPLQYEGGFPAPIGDVTIFQQTSGLRTYDVNTDGVAHYGLFADWFREVQLAAREQLGAQAELQLTRDMLNGAEDYLRTWERAVYGGGDCVLDGSTPQVDDLHAAVGLEVERFLTAIGQPVDRQGAAYVYCVEDEQGRARAMEVPFDADGRAGAPTPSDVQLEPAPATHTHGGTLVAAAAEPALAATGGGAALLGLGLVGLAFAAVSRGRDEQR